MMFEMDLTEEQKDEIARSLSILSQYLPGQVIRIPQSPRKKAINNFFRVVKLIIKTDLLTTLADKKKTGFSERVGKYFKHSDQLLLELVKVYNRSVSDEELKLTKRDLNTINRNYKDFLVSITEGIKLAVLEGAMQLK